MSIKHPLSPEECASRLHSREEDIRGPYFRDQTAIIHCNSFRRLKHKTQVFFAPENDHICTRIEHVLHVATIAATICRGLNQHDWQLDTELAYAAGLGHDIGHAPFGHTGEGILHELLNAHTGETFSHEDHSLRVLDHLENQGRGLNLTRGVRDAILCHNGEKFEQYLSPETTPRTPDEKKDDYNRLPATWEGCIVRLSDKIAYLGRDLEDALLARFLPESEVPQDILQALGHSNGRIINTLVLDLIENASRVGKIGFSDRMNDLYRGLVDFNVYHIYVNERKQEYEDSCVRIIRTLFERLMETDAGIDRGQTEFAHGFEESYARHREALMPVYERENACAARRVVDYLAGMTDNYAIRCYTRLTIPRPLDFPTM